MSDLIARPTIAELVEWHKGIADWCDHVPGDDYAEWHRWTIDALESQTRELAELRAQQPDRIEIRNNPDGTLDEVVGRGAFHLEQMDTGHWWLGFGYRGPLLHVNLRSRNKITATTLDDRTPDEKAENSPAQQPKAE